MKKAIVYLSLAGLLLTACQTRSDAPASAPHHSIVSNQSTQAQTAQGTIQGYLDDGIYTFKGIPYAKAERFMPPTAPDAWEGVKMCRKYGPKAPQGLNLKWTDNTKSDYDFGFQFTYEPMDEMGCQVLNVWTPSLTDGRKRPVFVWIHGGGYFAGSAIDLPCYEGRALAEKGDIVVVTLNHRLNVLGFIDLTALGGKYSESVNLGMLDIVKSLEWVRDNIAQFGGDPSQVTIAGQSGGGGKVSTLLAMPSAHGLFARAIVQSGSTLRQTEQETSQALGLAFVQELGLKAGQYDKLADFTYEELVEASQRATRRLAQQAKGARRIGMGPVVDGKTLPCHPFDPTAPEISRDIPMIIGSNTNEFVYDTHIECTMDDVRERYKNMVGEEQLDAFIAAYQQAYPKGEAKDLMVLDMGVRRGVINQANAKTMQEGAAPVYTYLFDWHPADNALGACHGMELPFMFNNIARQAEMTGGSEDAYALADLMSSAWINFVKTGDPNTPGLPTWQPYDAESGNTMILNNESHMVQHHDSALMRFARPMF